MPVETETQEEHMLHFNFNRIADTDETEVMLDLTNETAALGERLTEFFPEQIKQGTRVENGGRVEYRFKLTNQLAERLEIAIMEAVKNLQMTLVAD